MSTGTCGAINPDTAAHCVFGVGHAVQYHHGTDGVNWPVDPEGDETARRAVAHELATQDNRITSEPIFMVQERVRGRWENRQPFLTLKAAEAFRASEAHNHGETRVYVESGCRNPEWQLIRRIMGKLEATRA
jgi:hypothetical protein